MANLPWQANIIKTRFQHILATCYIVASPIFIWAHRTSNCQNCVTASHNRISSKYVQSKSTKYTTKVYSSVWCPEDLGDFHRTCCLLLLWNVSTILTLCGYYFPFYHTSINTFSVPKQKSNYVDNMQVVVVKSCGTIFIVVACINRRGETIRTLHVNRTFVIWIITRARYNVYQKYLYYFDIKIII